MKKQLLLFVGFSLFLHAFQAQSETKGPPIDSKPKKKNVPTLNLQGVSELVLGECGGKARVEMRGEKYVLTFSGLKPECNRITIDQQNEKYNGTDPLSFTTSVSPNKDGFSTEFVFEKSSQFSSIKIKNPDLSTIDCLVSIIPGSRSVAASGYGLEGIWHVKLADQFYISIPVGNVP